jgi:hypothetical protein
MPKKGHTEAQALSVLRQVGTGAKVTLEVRAFAARSGHSRKSLALMRRAKTRRRRVRTYTAQRL